MQTIKCCPHFLLSVSDLEDLGAQLMKGLVCVNMDHEILPDITGNYCWALKTGISLVSFTGMCY